MPNVLIDRIYKLPLGLRELIQLKWIIFDKQLSGVVFLDSTL